MFSAESVTFYMLNWHSVNFSTGYSLISLSLHLFHHFPPLPLSILPHPPFNFSPHHTYLPSYSPEQDEMAKNHNRSQGYRGRTLGPNPDKSLKSFPLCYSQSPLYSFVLRFPLLHHATSYSFYRVLLYTVKEKGGIPYIKPYPFPYAFRNLYRNLKFKNSQDKAQKPQRNCTFMSSASGRTSYWPVLTVNCMLNRQCRLT